MPSSSDYFVAQLVKKLELGGTPSPLQKLCHSAEINTECMQEAEIQNATRRVLDENTLRELPSFCGMSFASKSQ